MSNQTASVLYGAIIGDVAGSPCERNPLKSNFVYGGGSCRSSELNQRRCSHEQIASL